MTHYTNKFALSFFYFTIVLGHNMFQFFSFMPFFFLQHRIPTLVILSFILKFLQTTTANYIKQFYG